MTRQLRLLVCVLGVVAAGVASPTPAAAQAIQLTFVTVSGGVTVGGSGTDSGSVSFGNVSAFNALSPNVSRTNTSTDYTISTLVGVRVNKSGGSSPNYTLRARLGSSSTITWRVGGVDMTTAFQTVASLQPYNTTVPHDLEFVVPLTRSAGSISTTIQVRAIGN